MAQFAAAGRWFAKREQTSKPKDARKARSSTHAAVMKDGSMKETPRGPSSQGKLNETKDRRPSPNESLGSETASRSSSPIPLPPAETKTETIMIPLTKTTLTMCPYNCVRVLTEVQPPTGKARALRNIDLLAEVERALDYQVQRSERGMEDLTETEMAHCRDLCSQARKSVREIDYLLPDWAGSKPPAIAASEVKTLLGRLLVVKQFVTFVEILARELEKDFRRGLQESKRVR